MNRYMLSAVNVTSLAPFIAYNCHPVHISLVAFLMHDDVDTDLHNTVPMGRFHPPPRSTKSHFRRPAP